MFTNININCLVKRTIETVYERVLRIHVRIYIYIFQNHNLPANRIYIYIYTECIILIKRRRFRNYRAVVRSWSRGRTDTHVTHMCAHTFRARVHDNHTARVHSIKTYIKWSFFLSLFNADARTRIYLHTYYNITRKSRLNYCCYYYWK